MSNISVLFNETEAQAIASIALKLQNTLQNFSEQKQYQSSYSSQPVQNILDPSTPEYEDFYTHIVNSITPYNTRTCGQIGVAAWRSLEIGADLPKNINQYTHKLMMDHATANNITLVLDLEETKRICEQYSPSHGSYESRPDFLQQGWRVYREMII